MKRIFLLLGIFLLIFLVVQQTDMLPLQTKQDNTSPTNYPSTTVTIPEGWQTHEDSNLGVHFATPADYEIEQNGEYSILAKPPVNAAYPAGNARFFYVSVVPNALKDNETAQVYNYSASFHKKLLAIPVGEIKNLSELEGQKDWFYYERNGDDTFNGRTAKVFVNQRPWEFPNGTWEYRYIFELKDKTVIAGAYIEGGPSDAPFTLPVLQQIMGTLVINE